MKPFLKRTLLWVFFAQMMLFAPGSVIAQTVYCTNCASIGTQLQQYQQMVTSLANEATQISNQIRQIQIMSQNTTALNSQVYGNVAGNLSSLNNIMSQVQGLAFNASNLDSRFAQRFQGYNAYANATGGSMGPKYQQWSDDVNGSVRATLETANVQNAQFSNENALIQQLQSQNQSATGQMQAIQISNEIAIEQVAQIQKLRQLMMMQMQQEATYMQTQADQSQIQAANSQAAFVNVPTPSNHGNPRY